MAGLNNQCIFSVLLLSLISGVLSGVPVLLWEASSTSDKHDIIPALYQLDTDEFSNHIVKKVHVHKPLIVIFLEETLSVEDFSWQDVQHQGSFQQLRNLTKTAAKVEFTPSVEFPVDALKSLEVSHNYLWKKYDRNNLPTKGGVVLEVKMTDPLNNEDRPDLLRRHDANIAEIYSQLLAKHSSIIAIFTGKQSSWVEFETNRVRREAEESNNETSILLPANVIHGNISGKNFILLPFEFPVMKIKDERVNLTTPTNLLMDERPNNNYVRLITQYKYNEGSKLLLRYRFDVNEEKNDWKLSYVEFEGGNDKLELYPDTDLSAPIGKSVKKTTSVTFKAKDNDDFELRFPSGFQVQPYMLGLQFDAVLETGVVFFTPGIWSGLIVSFILGLILIWGIVMLMDIKTMDRFDDPKGKTISTGIVD